MSSAIGGLGLRLNRMTATLPTGTEMGFYQQNVDQTFASPVRSSSKLKRRSRTRVGPSPLGLHLGRSAFEERRTDSGNYVPLGSSTSKEDSKKARQVAAAHAAASRVAFRGLEGEVETKGESETPSSITAVSPLEKRRVRRSRVAVAEVLMNTESSVANGQEDVWTAGEDML